MWSVLNTFSTGEDDKWPREHSVRCPHRRSANSGSIATLHGSHQTQRRGEIQLKKSSIRRFTQLLILNTLHLISFYHPPLSRERGTPRPSLVLLNQSDLRAKSLIGTAKPKKSYGKYLKKFIRNTIYRGPNLYSHSLPSKIWRKLKTFKLWQARKSLKRGQHSGRKLQGETRPRLRAWSRSSRSQRKFWTCLRTQRCRRGGQILLPIWHFRFGELCNFGFNFYSVKH